MAYGSEPKFTVPPLTAYTAPTSGAATLVPPNTRNADVEPLGPNTATPVLGSATAETSATVRRAHPVSCCQLGLAYVALQPLPAPLHTVSVQPRVPVEVRSDVPPTAVTWGDDDGNSTPNPASPELAVIATPAWLYDASTLVVPDSPPP
ncbi:MAG TPA: hypothetical protein VHW23_25235 [Kofleriaceae bacterium]|nr:hypothetical protein [Kofleriaceae bacterium]